MRDVNSMTISSHLPGFRFESPFIPALHFLREMKPCQKKARSDLLQSSVDIMLWKQLSSDNCVCWCRILNVLL